MTSRATSLGNVIDFVDAWLRTDIEQLDQLMSEVASDFGAHFTEAVRLVALSMELEAAATGVPATQFLRRICGPLMAQAEADDAEEEVVGVDPRDDPPPA